MDQVDDGDDLAMGADGEQTTVLEDSEGGGGHQAPCCSLTIGLICLVVSTCALFSNEGKYVHTVKAIQTAKKGYVVPCTAGCSSCDFSKVREGSTDTVRPLKNGDMVYMACHLQGLETVNAVAANGFNPAKLTELVQAAEGSNPAAAFKWQSEMYQENYARASVRQRSTDPNFCHNWAQRTCDEQVSLKSWLVTGGSDAPLATTTTTVKPPSGDPCSGLNHRSCDAMPGTCTWQFPQCNRFADKNECRQHEPDECQWAPPPIHVDGTECTGCCKTEKSWQFACKPVSAIQQLRRASSQGSPDLLEQVNSSGHESAFMGRKLKEESKLYECSFETCHFGRTWSSKILPRPDKWPSLPLRPKSPLKFAKPPAGNLMSLKGGTWHARDRVYVGANRSGKAQGMSVTPVWDEVFPSSGFQPVMLKPHTAGASFTAPEQHYTYSLKTNPAKTIRMSLVDRLKHDWTANNSNVGTEACPAGCICSSSGSTEWDAGDLRMCFRQSSTTHISVIAMAAQTSDGWSLNPAKALGTTVKINDFVPADQMLKEAADDARALLQLMRFALAAIMWVGLYCCLSPLVWIIDQLGDTVKEIPCIGNFIGSLLECIETLADCLICVVSGCGALSCSLLVISFAWLWFRPMIGLPLLIVACALFGGLCYFAASRRGAPKVRGRRSSARQVPVRNEFQMSESTLSLNSDAAPPPVQFSVVCPAGVGPGGLVQVQAPDGRQVQVQVPAGITEGQPFIVAA